MIIGTAGHIDHGKSTLVRALTGTDTDRLPEEKARGISIALGYAYTTGPGDVSLGFIDVPGHERFVHTMLAGACGIDYALLVVAADDGVMPQTAEHVAILDLLGVNRGLVAITKVDRVEPARVQAVAADAAALLAPTGLAGAPVFAVDGRDAAHAAVQALKAELFRSAAAGTARRRDGLFRLCVDRAFSLPGHGTIVTGTAEAGTVRVGDTLTLLPSGHAARVRGLHAQNRPVEAGGAGDRLAINLAGVDVAGVHRGDWLCDARGLSVTQRVDARLSLLPAAPPLAPYAPVHVHYSAVHATAHVVGLDSERIAPGTSNWVQLVFDSPVVVPAGARFVMRNAQATRTIGGGVLLDAAAPARRRRGPARRGLVDALAAALATGDPRPILSHAPLGYSRAALMRATGRPVPDRLPAGVSEVVAGGGDADVFLIAADRWEALQARALEVLAAFHAERPAEPGPDAAAWRLRVDAQLPPNLWQALVQALCDGVRVRRSGAWLQIPAHGAALSVRDEADAGVLLARLRGGGYDPPWARDLARETAMPEARVRELLAGLGRAGRAYPVVADLYYAADQVAALAGIVAALAREPGGLDAARFRDRIGIGRKRAIQILEFFDRIGYTRRYASGRVLRSGTGWGGAG